MKLGLHRKRNEPPGFWHGEPRLYSRWRYRDRTYVLVTVSTYRSDGPRRGAITLEYEDEAAAKRHARSMNRYHKRQGLPVGNTAPCGALADFINGEC